MMLIQFLRDRRASVAPIFAVALLPMLIATGAAIDFSRAFKQRVVIQDSLDAAALAAGKKLGVTTDTLVKAEAQSFYTTNVGNKVDIKPTMTPTITSGQPTLTLTTQLHVPTYFLGIIGIKEFIYNLTAQSTQAMGTLEVAMALDNSTSMTIPSTKIAALKVAAADLANTLWGLGATSTKIDPVKIAIVPFGGAVNVGAASALSNNWVDTLGKGTYAADAMEDATLLGAGNNATSFNPYSIFSTLKDSSGNAVGWGGCVEARPEPYDLTDDAPSTSVSPSAEEKKTLFEPMVAPDEPDNWTCTTGTCSYVGSSGTRRWNGAPSSGTPDFNNYLPDVGDATTCGTISGNLSSITAATASPAVFNKSSHGLAASQGVVFSTTGSLPGGITAGTTYYVSSVGLTSGAFYVTSTTTGTNFTIGPALTTVTITNASPAVFTATAHGLTATTGIVFSTTGTLPAGLTAGTTYYVTAGGLTANNFKVTASSSATTFTVTKASPGVFTTSANHGLAAGNALVFSTTGALYTGLTAGTTYYVISAGLTATKFEVSTTVGGSAVNTSGSQSGTHSYLKFVTTTSAGSGTHSYTKVGAPSVFTSNGHGLSVGDAITLSSTGTLPTPLSASTVYYVVTSTTNTFTLSTTSGGTGINVSGSSTGTLSFLELLRPTSTSQSGTHSYATNTDAYTCDSGSACGGKSEKAAFGGQSLSSAPLCKYGTSSNKGTVANFSISGIQAGPNYMCSTTPITALTTSSSTVTSAINAMQANGYTNITDGLMWAWRVLSPGVPFTDGRASTDYENQKIIVLMTDGENTYLPYLQSDQNPDSTTYAGKFVKSAYGSWGYVAENHLGTTSTTSSTIFTQLNARTAAACTAAKAAGVRIYTVGFEINAGTASNPSAALSLLENCASDQNKYFDAQNEDDLTAAFTAIGDDISLLRLSM